MLLGVRVAVALGRGVPHRKSDCRGPGIGDGSALAAEPFEDSGDRFGHIDAHVVAHGFSQTALPRGVASTTPHLHSTRVLSCVGNVTRGMSPHVGQAMARNGPGA